MVTIYLHPPFQINLHYFECGDRIEGTSHAINFVSNTLLKAQY